MNRFLRFPADVDPVDSPTVSLAGGTCSPEAPPTPEPGRQFLPGTRFGERYRIVELLGRGGMGEVYRADDLQLGQTVALKFLPQHLTDDAAALARLRNEVRVARQISHTNVCRVYDIGEAEGQLFLSMEYIDGEDLASVLRRLGRPTEEKAIEISRQLCAGLAAAHETGVLHRDLKPDNVMIDGRGRVRITDFGLSAFAGELAPSGTAGTPAYMAPELFRGGASSTRSDIYALGAVLFELFTGRRAFRSDTISGVRKLHETEAPRRPSEIVHDIAPVVDEIILRCLDKDPSRRPGSALAVGAALPGQDLVAAALAAGQTPSPEMVAAAGGAGALRPWVAMSCLASIVAGLALIAGLNRRVALHGVTPPAKPAVILADEARGIMARLGYTETPVDTAYRWERYEGYLDHIEKTDPDPDRWSGLRQRRPPVYWLWYRESPIPLAPRNSDHLVHYNDPPATVPGMAGIKLDDQGRLAVLRVVPPQLERNENVAAGAVDYAGLFEAAGLDPADFREVEPRWVPPDYADARIAWNGHYPEQGDWAVRVEAASYAGRPVYFNVLEEFDQPWTGPRADDRPLIERSADWIGFALMVVALVIPPILARRNLHRGTGDRKLAIRVGLALWASGLAFWVLWADHTSNLEQESRMFLLALGGSVLLGVWGGLVYLALEPYVRRMLPGTMISWTRLLMGRPGNPRVGRDVLIGGLAGVLVIVIQRVEHLVPWVFGVAPPQPYGGAEVALEGGRKAWAIAINPSVLSAPLLVLLTLTVLLFLLRRPWLAMIGTFVVWAFADGHWAGGGPAIIQVAAVVEVLLVWSLILFVLIRFGLLAMVATFFFFNILQTWPLTLDMSLWFGTTSLIGMLLLVAIATVAARVSVGRNGSLAL